MAGNDKTSKRVKVLVINAGSSSMKYQLYQMPESRVLARGVVENIGQNDSGLVYSYGDERSRIQVSVGDHEEAMQLVLDRLADKEMGVIESIIKIDAVGHRVVHGGEEFTGSVIIDNNVIKSIEKFVDLAPLHNPLNLVGIRAAKRYLPNVTQVACFDTAFHTTIPKVAYLYALPYDLYEKYRVRRYGFHGISHRYVARRAARIMGRHKYNVNLVTCHLGNGCSLTAVREGRSIDTSMGLTPLEGVAMGTRSGDFDPAILFYLADKGYDMRTLNELCNKKSGLLGISGSSNDMRRLNELAEEGDERAQLAIEVFCYRVKKYIGAYASLMSRVDAVIFTGGIGENAAAVRYQICKGLEQTGIRIDGRRNSDIVGCEGTISSDDSRVLVLVVPTNEELAIAKDTFELAVEDCDSQIKKSQKSLRTGADR